MAIKSTLFLLAFVLLATRMASYAEAIGIEHHHHNHSKAPAKAPAHPPVKAPHHAPIKAPHHPPIKAPMHPPVVHHHKHVCVPKCKTHCKSKAMQPKEWCMKACTACCAKYKCVPDGSKQYCKNWVDGGVVNIHGKLVKCPA